VCSQGVIAAGCPQPSPVGAGEGVDRALIATLARWEIPACVQFSDPRVRGAAAMEVLTRQGL